MVFPSVPSVTATYANWASAPTTDGSIQYDNNGNNDGTGQTISAGNRVTFDGTYYYQFDAAGNRTFKYKSDTVGWTPRPRTSPSTPGTTATA